MGPSLNLLFLITAMRTGNAQTGATEDCPDNTGDGIINVADILNLLSKFGSVDDRVDVNKDGAVNVEDLLKVLGRFGSTCVPAPSVCADGLLLGVSFLNEAEDFSGNGGVVTYISAAGKRTIVSVPGTVIPEIGSTGVHFDGDGDYLTVKEGTDSYELDGMFSVSFWFTKEACTGGIYEYMFSHHERVDAAMWDFPYLDIYLGCESAGGGGSTLGGSVIRYWMRDTDGTEAMVDWPLADAGNFDDITSTWVDISLVVIPSSIFLFEDGERVPDLQYGFYGSLAEADNAADPLPSSLSTPFAAGGRQTNIFDFGIDIHIGGRADHNNQRHYFGHIAQLRIYSEPLSASQARCLFSSGEAVVSAASLAAGDCGCAGEDGGICCMAMSAVCLSCAQCCTAEQYCAENPGEVDCPAVRG